MLGFGKHTPVRCRAGRRTRNNASNAANAVAGNERCGTMSPRHAAQRWLMAVSAHFAESALTAVRIGRATSGQGRQSLGACHLAGSTLTKPLTCPRRRPEVQFWETPSELRYSEIDS